MARRKAPARGQPGAPARALIYTRISRDDAGTGLGVARQEEDCRALATRSGWTVVEIVTDNDVSAYSGRRRPGYQRLMDLVASGAVDAVIAWAPERLHRSPRELEDFIDIVEETGVSVSTVKAGVWDLSTSHGRQMARMLGAVSRGESERTGERVSRAHAQAQEAGLWRGAVPVGMRRVPGAPGGTLEPDPDAVGLVRETAARIQRGDALTTIAADLNRQGLRPRRGQAWTHTGVLRWMSSPALGGLIEVDGELRPATFQGCLAPDDWHSVRAALAARKRGSRRRPFEKLTLLGGLLTCAEHGVPLFGAGREYGPIYQASAPGLCYVSVSRAPVDNFIASLIVGRLLRPDAFELLSPPPGDVRDLLAEAETLRQRRAEISALLGDGLLTAADARDQLSKISDRLLGIESSVAGVSTLAKDAVDPQRAWANWNPLQRREVVSLLLERVAVRHQVGPTQPKVDLSRLVVKWQASAST